MSFLKKNIKNACLSGICFSAGSLLGKLSGGFPGYEDTMVVRLVCFILMITVNTIGWSLFVKALQQTGSSLPATIVSSTVNYLISAGVGFLFFGELCKLLWWCGTSLIICGLVLIASDNLSMTDTKKIS